MKKPRNTLNNDYECAFNDYWKDNMMEARLKVLHLSEEQKAQIKIEIELAFMAGYTLKQ